MSVNSSQPPVKREVQELSLLFEVSQILEGSLDLREVVTPMMEALTSNLGMLRCALTLLNRETGEIFVEAAHGLSKDQKLRGRYKLGEGLTGRVVATGQPVVSEKIADNPFFLHRTRASKTSDLNDISFVCVPIKMGSEVMGTLSIDRVYDKDHSLDDDVRVLSIVASMVAQAVRLRQTAQEDKQRLVEENVRLQEELRDRFRPKNLVGNSSAMQAVYDLIAHVSDSNTTVLLRGETGVGKELVAHAIHYNSQRANRPFIKVNCAALPETIIESELFGHEKGAFTGAVKERKGRFEMAHGGTIFLDEVGDLSASTQIKLLRVLQEREFERVGSTKPIKVDVRIITATNRSLEEMIESEAFRSDLYYRLNVFPIHIPPLRERKADVLQLADFFVEKYSMAQGKSIKRISTPAIDMITSYHWPGNVRELENVIERAVLLSRDDVIHGHHLPPTLQTAEASGTKYDSKLSTTLENVEREVIIEALKTSAGNLAKTARQLGITERIMGLRVKKYNIDPSRFKRKKYPH